MAAGRKLSERGLAFHEAWETTREVSGGLRVRFRLVRPDDRRELKRAFHELSPESRYRRFFTNALDLSEATLTYLTEVDGFDHVAIVAITESLDLKNDVGIGVARFVRLKGEPDVAEAAVTVVDPFQHRGLGRLLLRLLGAAAAERGVAKFRTVMLEQNDAMRALVGPLEGREEDGTVVVDAPVTSWEPHPNQPPTLGQKLLTLAAVSAQRLFETLHLPPLPASADASRFVPEAPPRDD